MRVFEPTAGKKSVDGPATAEPTSSAGTAEPTYGPSSSPSKKSIRAAIVDNPQMKTLQDLTSTFTKDTGIAVVFDVFTEEELREQFLSGDSTAFIDKHVRRAGALRVDRGDAAAATRIFRGDDVPRRRVAPTPRPRRG